MTMKTIKTVNDLPPGGFGIITEIHADDRIKQRLMDMGIIEGATVEMIRPAPLGDPIQIRVFNTLLALRRREASMLVIENIGETTHGRHRHRYGRKSKLR